MTKAFKSGAGYCTIGATRKGYPIIIYRTDEAGNTIINEREVLLIRLTKNFWVEKARLSIYGESYQWLRGELLLRDYDGKRCNLSRENWEKLRDIFNKKIKNLEAKFIK